MSALNSDYEFTGSIETIKQSYHNGFQVGWVETLTDTQLTVKSCGAGNDTYTVYTWNRPNVREELAKILGMPVKAA